jgi:signal transduction histidine kinase
MTSPPLDPKRQRSQTDQSLEAERQKSDLVIAEHLAEVEDDADEVVARARQQADDVLASAREQADDRAATEGLTDRAVVEERERQDEVLRQERRAADIQRRRERAALNALLPLDREKTDLYLLTERALSDDALANRDDFMGMVSHDLRNLLNNIALHAGGLSEAAPDTEEGRFTVHTMSKIKGAVGRMNRLIGDLVDIASIDAGKLAVRCDEQNVVDLTREAVETFARVAADKGVSLELRAPTDALVAWCDEGRLLQVLNNLINNALKFTATGGTVVVGLKDAGDDVGIAVTDTGIGIPAAKLELVFDRFAQVADRDTRGLGLGLYISRCIMVAHQGRIWATSTLGEGTTFHVSIPKGAPSTA